MEKKGGDYEKPGRVYLLGHEDWTTGTIGGYSPKLVDYAIRKALDGFQVRLISVIGCDLARDKSATPSAQSELVLASCNSFGAQLHKLQKGFCNELYARVFAVNVQATGTKLTDPDENIATGKRHRRASKIRSYWSGDRQKREWVQYKDAFDDGGAADREWNLALADA
jgi:hypothetical protein